MNLVLGICAAVAALVGLGLLWWRSRVGREIALMASLDTSGAGSVAQLPPGTAVEVKGTLRVRAPLAAEFSQQPAAWYRSEIVREETYYERDSQGRDQRRTRSTTVYQNMKYGQCLVEDRTGGDRLRGRRGRGRRGRQRADRRSERPRRRRRRHPERRGGPQ